MIKILPIFTYFMDCIEKDYPNVRELITDVLFERAYFPLRNFIFRGERSEKFSLLPSAFRYYNLKNKLPGDKSIPAGETLKLKEDTFIQEEYGALKYFFKICNRRGIHLPGIELFDEDQENITSIRWRHDQPKEWIPKELYEIASLAQHYGLPTRFLDWTYDFFTALYFASMGAVEKFHENKCKFDSKDKIVVWALNAEHQSFKKDSENYFPLKFIRPLYHRNPNITAQAGLFTHFPTKWQPGSNSLSPIVDLRPFDERIKEVVSDKPILFKLKLPITQATLALSQLREMGMDASKIFPGVEGAVKAIKQQKLASAYDWDWPFN